MTITTREEAIALLEQRIEESGLTSSDFAALVLIREPRTIRRWLTGEQPIPFQVQEFLSEPWVSPWPKEDPS